MNNAGFVLGVEKVGDISDADMEAMFTVNVFGLISLTQLFIKGSPSQGFEPFFWWTDPIRPLEFKARKAGHIINIGSIAGLCSIRPKITGIYSPQDNRPRALRWWCDLLCHEACRALLHRITPARGRRHAHPRYGDPTWHG